MSLTRIRIGTVTGLFACTEYGSNSQYKAMKAAVPGVSTTCDVDMGTYNNAHDAQQTIANSVRGKVVEWQRGTINGQQNSEVEFWEGYMIQYV